MQDTTTTAPPEEMVRDLETVLARRMEQVELENQRLRRLNRFSLVGSALALGMSAAVLVVAGAGRSTVAAESVSAERFVLLGPDGKTRGGWEVGADGSSKLVLHDGSGRSRVGLQALPDGSAGLALADGNGNSRAVLGLLPDQTASLVFADRTGRTRAVFGYSPDDAVNLAFTDRSGVTRAELGVAAAGEASFTLLEEQAAPEPEPATAGEAEAVPAEEEAQPAPAGPGTRGRR